VHVSIDLTTDPAAVALLEPDDCGRFDVVATGPGTAEDLDRALRQAAVGRGDGAEVLVTVEAVRRLAAGAVGDGWEADFAAMTDYAATKGWLSEDGGAIRAHVKWR